MLELMWRHYWSWLLYLLERSCLGFQWQLEEWLDHPQLRMRVHWLRTGQVRQREDQRHFRCHALSWSENCLHLRQPSPGGEALHPELKNMCLCNCLKWLINRLFLEFPINVNETWPIFWNISHSYLIRFFCKHIF